MDIIEHLILAFCGKKAIKSILDDTSKGKTQVEKNNYYNVKAYIKSIDKNIDEKRSDVTKDYLCSSTVQGDVIVLKKEFESIVQEERNKILNMYVNVKNQPTYLRWRTDLIEKLLYIEYYGMGTTQHLVHNELLYIINEFVPRNETETMIKKMCCFIDADYYFIQGQFEYALKRLYDVLEWDRILNNEWLKDGCSGNGLEGFYQSVVLNIINIYALLGLPEKTHETRRVFQTLYNQTKKQNQSIKSMSIGNSTEQLTDYLRKNDMAYDATSSFIGYASIRLAVYNSPGMFDEFVLGVFGNKQVYNISPGFYYETEYNSVVNDNDECVSTMAIKEFGTIIDINRKIAREREGVEQLT